MVLLVYYHAGGSGGGCFVNFGGGVNRCFAFCVGGFSCVLQQLGGRDTTM